MRFLLIIARANVPWSAVWRGSGRSMDTNRCHRASRYALEARRMAIAVTDELQESVRQGTNRALRAVCGRQVFFLQTIARADVPWSAVWRGSRCSIDTNRCHRASGYALEAPRMAIAVTDELQEMRSHYPPGRLLLFSTKGHEVSIAFLLHIQMG